VGHRRFWWTKHWRSCCRDMLFAVSIAYLELMTMLINPQELWLLLNNQFSEFWELNDPVSRLYEHLPTGEWRNCGGTTCGPD
jgi:hypothetical protein